MMPIFAVGSDDATASVGIIPKICKRMEQRQWKANPKLFARLNWARLLVMVGADCCAGTKSPARKRGKSTRLGRVPKLLPLALKRRWFASTAENYRKEVKAMSEIKFAEYINTGGNCYVMFGNAETGEVGGDGVWFAMSVDADVEPIIQFYETEEDAYNCDAEHGFIREVRESDGEDWFAEFCTDAFHYAIENSKTSSAERMVALYDAGRYFGYVYEDHI